MAVDRDAIGKLLTERGAVKPCHRCGQTSFTVLERFSRFVGEEALDGPMTLGGLSIPVVMVACTNCGAITPHAAGALGLLKKQKEG